LTSGWHNVEAAVPLGRLSAPGPVAVAAELVTERDRALAQPCPRAARNDGVLRQPGSSRVFTLVRPSFEPDVRRIVVADVALTPNSNIAVRGVQAHLDRASRQHVWQIGRTECSLPQMELQSTIVSRRIWTRELLTLGRCELERQTAFESKVALMNERQGHEESNLVRDRDYQPIAATLPRLAAQSLPSAPVADLEQIRPLPQDGYQAPHMIGPRLKLQFDILPSTASLRPHFPRRY
jgi:hypothetical protein